MTGAEAFWIQLGAWPMGVFSASPRGPPAAWPSAITPLPSCHPAALPTLLLSTLATALVFLRNTTSMPSTSPQTQSTRLLLQGPQAGWPSELSAFSVASGTYLLEL